MILGCYYITTLDATLQGAGSVFSSKKDLSHAYDAREVELRTPVKVRIE